ncbi:MAG TPA: hypothetical protein VF546_12010 [Pyrinomonadaceae bacterium]|jgi:hypothetical protein
MAEPKVKPEKRVAGKSKFRLPERPPRPVEENPLRDLLREAKAQEEALVTPQPQRPPEPRRTPTPAKRIAGVKQAPLAVVAPVAEPAAAKPKSGAAAISSAPAARTAATVPFSFAEFSKRWAPILRSGQMGVCRVLFELTHERGLAECFTSMPKLAAAAGLKERQCYNVIAQLEMLGFIERPEIFNTPTRKGTIFRLHLEPQPPAARAARRYHIGGVPQEEAPDKD